MVQKLEAKPTQQLVEIEEIRDGLVILKNGALRQIMMVGGVNFDLKSEEEQGLLIFGYQNFLNSLNFSMQTFIHSRKLNIEGYLKKLEGRKSAETNELLKNQVSEYIEFIKSFVSANAIMEKTFFVVVPFDPIQIPAAGMKITEKIFSFLPGKKKTQAVSDAETEQARLHHIEQLNQRVDQVTRGLGQIGLRAVPLDTEQAIELFYNLYNPQAVEKAALEIAKE